MNVSTIYIAVSEKAYFFVIRYGEEVEEYEGNRSKDDILQYVKT